MGRIVITGSDGLVGKAVVTYALKHTHHQLVLVDVKPLTSGKYFNNSRIQLVVSDLTVAQNWAPICKGADALIHLAATYLDKKNPTKAHNINVTLSWNALCAAAAAGIQRVVLSSSINAIGGLFNAQPPRYLYFPLDEQHPSLAEDAYSLSKLILEAQASCIVRSHPTMRIASLRFHFVSTTNQPPKLTASEEEETRKDLWGWVSVEAAARACFLGLEMKEEGHEVFFVVAPEHACGTEDASELAKKFYPDTEMRGDVSGKKAFYDCSKAERILGWKHEGGREPALEEW